MLVLTFIFAVLNICLGFALAMYLGYGLVRKQHDLQASESSRQQATLEMDTAYSSADSGPIDEVNEDSSQDSQPETPDIDAADSTTGEPALESYENTVA